MCRGAKEIGETPTENKPCWLGGWLSVSQAALPPPWIGVIVQCNHIMPPLNIHSRDKALEDKGDHLNIKQHLISKSSCASETVHRDSILNQHCFTVWKVGVRKMMEERRDSKEGVTLYSHSWLRKNKATATVQKYLKWYLKSHQQCLTSCCFTRNEIAYWGSFKSSQLICCACIRYTKNSLYSFSPHKSPQ